MPSFHLVADVSSDAPDRVRPVVAQLFPTGVTETAGGFHIEAVLEGESARDLNRTVLSALRKTEKRTRLRAAWTSGGTTDRFFDYGSKGSRPAG
jgi:phage tail tape-measure protein